MDGHNDLLGELAADAALERSDFLVQSTEQFRKFLDRHRVASPVAGRPNQFSLGHELFPPAASIAGAQLRGQVNCATRPRCRATTRAWGRA